jgi:UDP-N-acetylglucosamine 2-epimerase (non-hydrolysing)
MSDGALDLDWFGAWQSAIRASTSFSRPGRLTTERWEIAVTGRWAPGGEIVKIANIVGARPNFMKIAPLLREMRRWPEIRPTLIHTGQHYDASMASRFFEDLEIPPPDVSLEVGSGSHAAQTAEVMKRLEPVLCDLRPDVVLVVGDVNSTVAAALTAVKLGIAVAHVEAGLRSFDRSMPEEINRLVTDAISEYLFVTEESGQRNLVREGIDARKIHMVGNVMIDSLDQCRRAWARSSILADLGLPQGGYGVVTLHRPSNVDDPVMLGTLVNALTDISRDLPLVFPVHPRTRARLDQIENGGHAGGSTGVRYVSPLGYLDFMALVAGARLVLTDSGGLQEETTALGVPCLTLREQTERPVTVTRGTNHIVGTDPSRIVTEASRVLAAPLPPPSRVPLWDGRASQRIVAILLRAGVSRVGLSHEVEKSNAS